MADDELFSTLGNQVLRMVFDNSQFDKNVAKSTKTAEDFKRAMDFDETSKGLSRFASSVNELTFERFFDNVQALTDKFTGFGDATEYVISRIRASFEDAAKSVESFVKSITLDQFNVGQSKYDALNKAVMTISATGKYTEEEAYQVMERLMTYTNETSYSFANMVDQVSAFTSAGQDLGTAEKAMEGIANAVAKAGKGTSEATAAMQTFAKVMGAGYLSKNQWDSLNLSAHMITEEFRQVLIDTAVEAGNLTKQGDVYRIASQFRSDAAQKAAQEAEKAKTEKGKKAVDKATKAAEKAAEYERKAIVSVSNLEETLHNKWLTADVVMKSLEKYYFEDINNPNANWDTFAGSAAKAAQRALSLADAINAMKEASSAGWMTSFRLFWGDLSESMLTFTRIANRVIEIIDKISDFRNNVLEVWANNGGRTSIVDILLGDYDKELTEGIYGLIDLIEDAGTLVHRAMLDFFKLFVPEEYKQHWNDEGFAEAFIGGELSAFTRQVSQFITDVKNYFDGEIMVEGQTKSRLEFIYDIIQGVVGALGLAQDLLSSVGAFFIDIAAQLGPSFDPIIGFLSQLGQAIYGSAEDAEKTQSIRIFFHELAAEFAPLTSGIVDFVVAITELLSVILDLDKQTGSVSSAIQSIGGALKKAANVITTVGVPVIKFITDFITVINELVSGGFTEENLVAAGNKLAAAFRVMLASLLQVIPNKPIFVQNWINALLGIDGITSAAEPAKNEMLTNLYQIIHTIFENLRNFLTQTIDEFNFADIFNAIGDFVANSSIIQGAIDFFKNVNIFALLMAFLGVATITSIWRLISAARKAVVNVNNIISSFTGGTATGFVSKSNELSAAMMNMAKAIAIVAASATVLGSMPTAGLVQGVLAVIVVIGALLGFAAILAKLSNGEKLTDKFALAGQIIALSIFIGIVSAGIGLIMLAITPLAMNTNAFIVGVVGVIALLTAVGFFISAMAYLAKDITSKYNGLIKEENRFWKIALALVILSGAMVVISASISLLILAITPLAALGWDDLARALLAIAGTLTIIGAFLYIVISMTTSGRFKKLLASSGSMIAWAGSMVAVSIAMAVSIGALAVSLMLIMTALLPMALLNPDNWVRGMLGLMIILGSLIEFMSAVKKLKLTDMNIIGLSAFAGGIGILINSLTPLSKMSFGGWLQSMAGFALVLVMLGHFMKSLTELKHYNANSLQIAGLVGFAFGLGVLMLALTPLASMSWEGWVQSMAGLALVLTMLGFFMKKINEWKVDSVKIVGLAGFTFGIGLLMASLNTISGIKWTDLGKALLGMMGVMALLLIFMKALEQYEVKQNVKIIGIIGFAAGVWLLVQAMIPLAGMSMNEIFTGVTGLLGVLLALGLFLKALDGIKVDLGKTVTLVILMITVAGLMVVLALVMDGIKTVDPWLIISFAGGLSLIIFTMASVISMLSNIPFTAGLKGIVLLAAGVAAIMGVIALMIPMILGGIGTGLADAGGKLKLASGTISDFVSRMNEISDGNVDHAKSILEKLKDVLGAASGFGGYGPQIQAATTTLYDLGTGLEIFEGHSKELSENGAAAAIQLIQDLAGCSNDLKTIEQMNIKSFTSNLTGLAGAMKLYTEATKGTGEVDDSDIPNVDHAIQILDELSKGLVEHGGFQIPSDMPNEEAIGLFGAQLAALAMAMVDFEKAGSQLGDGTDKALAALDFFSDIKAKLTAIGAVNDIIGYFTGQDVTTDKFTEFGKNIEKLGGSLAKFADSTTIVDAESGKIVPIDFTNATTALQNFVDLKDKLPDIPPEWMSWLTGKNSELTQLAGDIENLGGALSDFSEKAVEAIGTEEKKDSLDSAIKAIDAFVNMDIKLPDETVTPAWLSWLTGRQKTLGDMGTYMSQIGPAIEAFSKSATNAVATDDQKKAIGQAISAIDEFIDVEMKLYAGQNKNEAPSWLQQLVGRKRNLEDAAGEMTAVGSALEAFSANATNAVNTQEKKDAIENAIKMIGVLVQGMTDIADAIPEDSDFGSSQPQWLTDLIGTHSSLDTAAGQMAVLGASLKTFSDNAVASVGSQDNVDAMNTAITVFQTLTANMTKLTTELPRIGGLANVLDELINGSKVKISDVANDLGYIGESLGTFGEQVSGKFTDADSVNIAMDVIKKFADILIVMAQMDTEYNTMGFAPQVMAGNFVEFLGILAKGISEDGMLIEDGSPNVVSSIFHLITAISAWANTQTNINGEAIQSFRDMTEALLSLSKVNIQNLEQDFSKVGNAIASGVALGIANGKSQVFNTIRDMMIEAYIIAMNNIEASSPSKVFTRVGSYIPMGMALGIDNGTDDVVGSVENMSNKAIDTAAALMTEVSRIMAEDTNSEPTITPVLDLTNVRNGVDYMNRNLHSGTVHLNTAMPVSYASGVRTFSGSYENQNGTDLNGVYTSINQLGERIADVANSIKKLRLVLDTGVVAGAVTDEIDINLGRKSFYAGRRN